MDNFSAGTRGSASAEYFLERGYAVIFMHRLKSLEPFTRHFTGQQFFDMLDLSDEPNNTILGKYIINYVIDFQMIVSCNRILMSILNLMEVLRIIIKKYYPKIMRL